MNLIYRTYLKHFPKAKEKYFLRQLVQVNNINLSPSLENNEVHFKHSGLVGDIIYAIPAMKALANGKDICLHLKINEKALYNKNMKHFNKGKILTEASVPFLQPLLLIQPGFKTCDVLHDQPVNYDLDAFRKYPNMLSTNDIVRWNFLVFGLSYDLSKPWLQVEPNAAFKDEIVIARSFRYRTPGIDYSFLKTYPHLSFVGLPDEYEDMKKALPSLKYCPIKNALEMAQIIAGCKFFIGNQSFPFALAEALKVKRLLEVYFDHPDVVVTGKDAYDFYMQPQFEKIVHSLLR